MEKTTRRTFLTELTAAAVASQIPGLGIDSPAPEKATPSTVTLEDSKLRARFDQEYGKKVDALRRRYRSWLWDTEFRDRLGAEVLVDGRPYSLYSVFQNASGKRTIVIVNEDLTTAIRAKPELPRERTFLIVTPELPEARSAPDTVTIPPRSAAVLMEQ